MIITIIPYSLYFLILAILMIIGIIGFIIAINSRKVYRCPLSDNTNVTDSAL